MCLRFLVAVSLSIVTAVDLLASQSSTKWIMLNVTPAQAQADCHLLQLPDGSNILIDAGEAWDAPNLAVTLLKKLGVHRISLVVISHFHKDHYRSEEHTSELQSLRHLVCRLLLEKKQHI